MTKIRLRKCRTCGKAGFGKRHLPKQSTNINFNWHIFFTPACVRMFVTQLLWSFVWQRSGAPNVVGSRQVDHAWVLGVLGDKEKVSRSFRQLPLEAMKIVTLFALSAAVKFRVHPTADDEWLRPYAAYADAFVGFLISMVHRCRVLGPGLPMVNPFQVHRQPGGGRAGGQRGEQVPRV